MHSRLTFVVVALAVIVVIDVVVTGSPLKVSSSSADGRYSNEEEVSNAEAGLNITDLNHYLTLQEYYQFMKELNSSYPNLEVVTYGKSYEGRDLMAIKFFRNPCNPVIFVEAGIHAREWISFAVTVKIINNIAKNSSQDEEMSKLLDLYNWVFVPLVNPDGYDYSHHEHRYWRKNRRNVTAKCQGVDLNRNFDIAWGTLDASPKPCEETYCGTAPFTEPETQSLKRLVHDSWPLIGYISLHSYGQLVLCPYTYTKTLGKDYEELYQLALKVTSAIYNATGEKYDFGEGARTLYEASGCSMDWVKQTLGVKYSFTIEMRPNQNDTRGFVLPTSEIEPTYTEIYAALKTFGNGFNTDTYLKEYFENCTAQQALKERKWGWH